TTGSGNTASGVSALQSNTTADNNTASGVSALQNNTTGDNNTAYGASALLSNTTSRSNTAVGVAALLSHTTGDNNTAVGLNALIGNTTGHNNIAIGINAGANLTGGDNNIYVGSDAPDDESATMRLGSVQTSTFLAGIVGATVSNSAQVLIDTRTGQLRTISSSIRYKRDIEPMGGHSRGLFHLRPVIFRYTQDPQGERQYGLIAEEVAKVYPELVTRNAQGQVEAIRYQELTPMLLNELQHQQRQLAELKAQNARLRAAVAQQQERDAALAARLERLEAAAARAASSVALLMALSRVQCHAGFTSLTPWP